MHRGVMVWFYCCISRWVLLFLVPKQINRYLAMEGILQNKQPYETLKVQVVNLIEENSILACSDYWTDPLD